MKRILIISLWCGLGIGLIVSLAFASRANGVRICEEVKVSIERKNTQVFISEDDVLKLLRESGMDPLHRPLSAIRVNALEKLVSGHPAVESCDVFMDINGNVNVDIHQRSAVARIMNSSGQTFYFDDRGYIMPWNADYSVPLILANGEFSDNMQLFAGKDLKNIVLDSALISAGKLDDIWKITELINKDSLLSVQIIQVYYSAQKGFILVPRIGDQEIVLGDISDLGEKLNKLLIFYREGLAKTGKWNQYRSIDLQYKNQVVCTKK